ncbi:DNA topoisomerase III [Acetonema longum DSM 6540]|uniref:DNA topoisomerase III n=1 Tax=Acetonema longum DSM 6540 TaxID=1009370 RepID=F7NDM7_9FIRM|nr:DNA topoisomerase III [Acetonema longum DSM 6540]
MPAAPTAIKKLELRGEGEHRLFACVCGYREKLTAFEERRQTDHGKVSKQEVSRYLKEQKKAQDQPINSALADALAKLKLPGNR